MRTGSYSPDSNEYEKSKKQVEIRIDYYQIVGKVAIDKGGFLKNRDDNIHPSEALKLKDKRNEH